MLNDYLARFSLAPPPGTRPDPPPPARPRPRTTPSLELGLVVESLSHHGLAHDLPVGSELDTLPTLLSRRPEDLALQPSEGGLLFVAQALLDRIQIGAPESRSKAGIA